MNRPRLITTTVCAALNREGARYLVIGDVACVLHGHVRPAMDVDILIERTIDNARRVLKALAEAGCPAATEWPPDQLVHKPVTVIGDDPAVNVYAVAWSVKYAGAIARATTVEVEDVTVPVIGLDDLIATKRTGRLEDAQDIEALEEIKRLRVR
jgi:predicted nucleotidyltransferase